MSIRSHITDLRKGYSLRVEDDGSINAYIVPRPPIDSSQFALPFAQLISTNGESTGTTDMRVNGATTSVDFYVGAKSYDLYINTISVVISDANATLNQFGNLGTLTNGIEFYYFNQSEGKYTIESAIKTNFEFLRLGNFEPSFGTGTAAFQGSNVIGTSEAYMPIIDLEDIFGVQYGLKLRANTTDRLGFIVKDNLTALDGFDIKVYGIRL